MRGFLWAISFMRGLLAAISLMLNLVLPIALSVGGYLCFFQALDCLYLIGGFGVWIIAIVTLTLCVQKEARTAIYYQAVGGAIGWVWLLSIPASLWFLFSAIFMGGSWWELAYSFLLGGVAKGFLRYSTLKRR